MSRTCIFMFNCFNNLFTHSFNIVFNREYNNNNNNNNNNAQNAFSNWNWGLWTSTNFAANEWNNLDKSLRELKSLDKFKKAIRNDEVRQYNIIMDVLGGWSRDLDILFND